MAQIARCDRCERHAEITYGHHIPLGWYIVEFTSTGALESRHFCPFCAEKILFTMSQDSITIAEARTRQQLELGTGNDPT